MAEKRIYLAIGEEAARGTKESAAVGFIPLLNPGIPKITFDDKRQAEWRGEEAVKGDISVRRMSRRWSASLETPFFTEAGGVKGMTGTILKHFFGKAASMQNNATGQYGHMFYPVPNPFDAGNIGDKALTLNLNINEGAVMKNWPFVGGRVMSLTFSQEAGGHLLMSCEFFGQKRDGAAPEIGAAVFAAENLRCDFNNVKVYTGALTRIGAAPDYTDFTFDNATSLRPDKLTLKIENGMEDALRLSGLDYPDKTRMGKFKVSLDMTLDWEDPASGFSSVDEFNSWLGGASSTNFCAVWDTGTQAGTGGNHGLIVDVPIAHRLGGDPDYSLEKDPMISLKYEGLYDAATTKYLVGILLKNTASAV
ncbi:MAG: hypothetical protein HY884_06910 [Deltaproteobacteria bacterium]|nr:hypothetical protein [Deltaproteobacteria bacterium]